jgi:hypothetical protein
VGPIGGANTWRQAIDGADWMREVEKRILHEERRPNVRTAADILGPGIGPYSVLLDDWNAAETVFNGLFHSLPGAANAPLADRYWMGTCQATSDGYGLQRVDEYQGSSTAIWPRAGYLRKFFTPAGQQRQFSSWQAQGTPVGLLGEFAVASAAPNGWLLCDGSLLDSADYPDLFAVIGSTYNTGGEPAGQFRLPTINGKVIKT